MVVTPSCPHGECRERSEEEKIIVMADSSISNHSHRAGTQRIFSFSHRIENIIGKCQRLPVSSQTRSPAFDQPFKLSQCGQMRLVHTSLRLSCGIISIFTHRYCSERTFEDFCMIIYFKRGRFSLQVTHEFRGCN